MKYVKRPIPTPVSFAKTAGVLETLEGPVAYAAGDALMTGIQGEHWPIRRARFEEDYRPADTVRFGDDGLYIKKPKAVDARQASADEVIALSGERGQLHARAGDWIVTAVDGQQWVVAKDIFDGSYQIFEEGNQNDKTS